MLSKFRTVPSAHSGFSNRIPRFSLPIFKVFGGALNRAGAHIKTYEKLDSPFPAHTRTLFTIYDN